MARTIDIVQLEKRARAALGKLPWWDDPGGLPAEYERPQVYRMLIDGLAGKLPARIASSKEFLVARQAVAAWAGAQALAEEVRELASHPAIIEAAGGEANVRWLLQNPEEARQFLVKASVEVPGRFKDGSPLGRALMASAQYETFYEDHGDGADTGSVERVEQVQAAPEGRAQKAESGGEKPAGSSHDELIAKPKLSQAEYKQLVAWAEEDQAIEDKLLPETYYESSGGDGENES